MFFSSKQILTTFNRNWPFTYSSCSTCSNLDLSENKIIMPHFAPALLHKKHLDVISFCLSTFHFYFDNLVSCMRNIIFSILPNDIMKLCTIIHSLHIFWKDSHFNSTRTFCWFLNFYSGPPSPTNVLHKNNQSMLR